MLTVSIIVVIWAILGIAYALIRDLDKFDIPISIWIATGIFIVGYVCIKNMGIF